MGRNGDTPLYPGRKGTFLIYRATLTTQADLFGMSLRQESSGKEEETRTLKPFVETLRV